MVELQRAAEFKLGGDDGPTITPSESLDEKGMTTGYRRYIYICNIKIDLKKV